MKYEPWNQKFISLYGSAPVIGSGQLGSLSKCESSTFENKEKVAAICLILVLERCMIAQNVRKRVQNMYIMLKMTFKMFLGVSTYYYASGIVCRCAIFASARIEFFQNFSKNVQYFSYLMVKVPQYVLICVLQSVPFTMSGHMQLSTPFNVVLVWQNENPIFSR